MTEINVGTNLASLELEEVQQWLNEKRKAAAAAKNSLDRLEITGDTTYLQVLIYINALRNNSSMFTENEPVMVGESIQIIRDWPFARRTEE